MPNSTTAKPKLLLHTCCAPCLTHPLQELQKEFEVIAFYYNPNIHPREEYEMRIGEMRKYLAGKCEMLEAEYDAENWFVKTRGFEMEKERGLRCKICYEMRMRKTAQYAKKNGFAAFTTTLSISPHKNSGWLNEIGKALEKELGIRYIEADWKKCDGFKKSLDISRAENLQRQDYCGCIYSKRDRDLRVKK
ncbi:MAG: epoxyqueuosine reductase QueH [Candidatus Gracilibacteria bacterium]|nr:epoxyqueuosine reductase QueH [Candidatus Gracilibacteria bacterium]